MVLLNYDNPDKDIYTSFCGATGIDSSRMTALESRINRSLISEELEVIRMLNGLHPGNFSTPISKYLINLSPNTPASVHYEESLVESVRVETATDLQWINQQFKLEPPALSDLYTGGGSSSDPQRLCAIYGSIIDWASTYDPSFELAPDFQNFLQNLSIFLAESSTENLQALATRAQDIADMANEPKT
jgi:hypothetical protein